MSRTRDALVIRPVAIYSSRVATFSELDFSGFNRPEKFGPNVSDTEKRKNRNRAKLQRASRRKNRSM